MHIAGPTVDSPRRVCSSSGSIELDGRLIDIRGIAGSFFVTLESAGTFTDVRRLPGGGCCSLELVAFFTSGRRDGDSTSVKMSNLGPLPSFVVMKLPSIGAWAVDEEDPKFEAAASLANVTGLLEPWAE